MYLDDLSANIVGKWLIFLLILTLRFLLIWFLNVKVKCQSTIILIKPPLLEAHFITDIDHLGMATKYRIIVITKRIDAIRIITQQKFIQIELLSMNGWMAIVLVLVLFLNNPFESMWRPLSHLGLLLWNKMRCRLSYYFRLGRSLLLSLVIFTCTSLQRSFSCRRDNLIKSSLTRLPLLINLWRRWCTALLILRHMVRQSHLRLFDK